MEIRLANIYVGERLPNKTMPFMATLFIKKYKVAAVTNEAREGVIFYHPFDEKGICLIREAEAWCRKLPLMVFPDTLVAGKPMTAPVDLETYICNLLADWLKLKDLEKMQWKMEKEMNMGILYGVPGKSYRVMRSWKPVNAMIRYGYGVEQLRREIRKRVLPVLGEGEKILNTNIPLEVVRALGIEFEWVGGK